MMRGSCLDNLLMDALACMITVQSANAFANPLRLCTEFPSDSNCMIENGNFLFSKRPQQPLFTPTYVVDLLYAG